MRRRVKKAHQRHKQHTHSGAGNSGEAVVSLPDGLRAAALQLGRLKGDGVDVGEPLRDFQLWAHDSFSEWDSTSYCTVIVLLSITIIQ